MYVCHRCAKMYLYSVVRYTDSAVPCNYSEEGMQFSCLADALQGRDTAAYMIVHVHAEILSEPAITLWTSGQ